VSDWFIEALDPAVRALGISKEFAGLVLVAIAGNAVENATGVVLAAKGHSDLAISVVKNSVAQIAAFLFPALVLISAPFKHSLTFQLQPVYIGGDAFDRARDLADHGRRRGGGVRGCCADGAVRRPGRVRACGLKTRVIPP
jgi:hypothetical protein